MKKKKLNILLDNRKFYRQPTYEIFLKIVRSILQNNNINFLKKFFFCKFLIKLNGHIFYKNSKKIHTCIITGRRRGLIKLFSFSRHQINYFAYENKLDNVRSNS